MAFELVIGQGRAKQILSAAVHRDRLPHALLFHGPEGVGKDALALELAKLLNCSHPPCRTCPSCLKISQGQHPDVKLILPVPSSMKVEEIGILLRERAQQPYFSRPFTKPASISIEAVRELQKALAYRPFEGKWKVVLVAEADRMTPEAANALLKTLEEPPPATVLILTTARPHALLPTIVSRCQKLRLDPLSEEEIEKALIDRLKADLPKARLASRLAVGNYRKAMEFIDEDVDRLREEALGVLTVGLSATVAEMVEAAESLSGRVHRDDLKNLLNVALLWMRDLLLLHEGRENEGIANVDRLAELRKLARKYPSPEIGKGIAAVKGTLEVIDRNANQQLALMGLMLQLKKSGRYGS
ncbi:MAG: DNA polymerase III subunit delta' [bacterium]